MRGRQAQNKARAARNHNEQWMAEKLATTGLQWTTQAQWGYRLFDFWSAEKGIAIEVDGPEHDTDVDAYRDRYNFERSGIEVIRVRNRNEADAIIALDLISSAESWQERRKRLGIVGGKRQRRARANGQVDAFVSGN